MPPNCEGDETEHEHPKSDLHTHSNIISNRYDEKVAMAQRAATLENCSPLIVFVRIHQPNEVYIEHRAANSLSLQIR